MRDYIDNPHLKVRGENSSSPVSMLHRHVILAIVLCIAAGVLVWLDVSGTLPPVRQLLGQGVAPVAHQLTNVRNGVADLWGGISELQHLREENEALHQQVSQLQAELLEREETMVENARLRQQLAIEEEQPWHLLGTEVTMRSPDAGRRVITIASGSRDGVEVGMAVVGQTGGGPVALVGIVEEVGPHTANVLLTTDFGSRISARVLHDGDTALGLVQGQWQRGSRLRLEQVDRVSLLVVGAKIISAGLTNEMGFELPLAGVPAGIPIGEIEALTSDGHEQFAELRPYADPDQVRYVWVILRQEN
jgi:rod shape-determining protein MreC